MKNMTDQDRDMFANLTEIGDLLFDQRKGTGLASISELLFDDKGPHREYSSRIHKRSKVDACTKSLTNNKRLTHIHCDTINDDSVLGKSSNYDFVVIVWRCYRTNDGGIDRVAFIAYSRRSISDTIVRKQGCEAVYQSLLLPWINDQPVWKSDVNVDTRIFSSAYAVDGLAPLASGDIHRTPHFNKQVCYLSGFCDALITVSTMLME